MQDKGSRSMCAARDDEASDPQTSTAAQANNKPLFNVMLTCYSLFERDSADQQADRSFLKKWGWSHLLLDEAHAVKNAMAMRTKRLTRCAVQSMSHFVKSMIPPPKLRYERHAHDDNTSLLPFCLQIC